MKYFLADYKTFNGEHEYPEFGVLAANTWEKAEKQAIKGKKLFVRFGWEEFCILNQLREIPIADYEVLKKYFAEI